MVRPPQAEAAASVYAVPSVPQVAAPPLGAAARTVHRPSVRPSTLKRRRDVFLALLVTMAATLLLGFIPVLRMMWVAHLVVDVLFAAYVAMLVRLRNLAAEREMKVRFLPGAGLAGAGNLQPAFLLRRSAN